MAQRVPYKLLLAVDGSMHADRAAHYLAHYAKKLGTSHTIVLYVHPAESLVTRSPEGAELTVDLHAAGIAASHAARRILDAANVAYRFDTQLGIAADVIAYTAEMEQVDEVVMGSRGISQWKGLVVGSVAHKVIHQLAVPVTVVGTPSRGDHASAAEPDDLDRILIAADGSSHALRAAQYVCKLHDLGVPLTAELLNVPVPIPPGYLRSFLTDEIIENYYREEGVPALHEASAALQAAQITFDTHILAGHAAERIIEAARRYRCGRIVMGTRGLGTLAGLTLGSVAYQVVHLSPVPVTLVK